MTWETPIMTFGSVDMYSFDPQQKNINFNVHIECLPCDLKTPELKNRAQAMAQRKLQYLVDEGFTETVTNWKVGINIVGHPPKTI
jgi:hypothetical protein